MHRPPPLVSIGLPVHNGEKYIASALDSILGQTWSDLELVISDNASTDGTAEICRRYAARDPRISYFRTPRNLGAASNFNRTFALSSGEYFKWAAHDDLLCPEYVERCVGALEARPGPVLCQSLIQAIDARGRSLGVYDSHLVGSASNRQADRFAALVLRPHPCTEVFGLIRRDVLAGSILLGSFHGCDRALLADLALLGPFSQVPEPLLMIREHEARYTQAAVRQGDRMAWHDTRHRRWGLPTWQLYGQYLELVAKRVPGKADRCRCYGHLLRWWLVNWNWARMAVDILAVVNPGIVGAAERLKQRAFSPRPGAFPEEKAHPSAPA